MKKKLTFILKIIKKHALAVLMFVLLATLLIVNYFYHNNILSKISTVDALSKTTLSENVFYTYQWISKNTEPSLSDSQKQAVLQNTPATTDSETTYSSISELVKTQFPVGTILNTLGYYSKDSGGSGTYLISDDSDLTANGTTVISLDNGLLAILQVKDNTVSVKQFGAYGDASHDDSDAFKNALNAGYSTVDVTDGTYNLAGSEIEIPGSVILQGSSANTCILKNVNFIAPSGIEVTNLTFDGGTERTVSNSYQPFSGTMMILTTPTGSTSIKYSNCVFQNTDYVSFGMTDGTGSANNFSYDGADKCSFINIGKIAIFHSVDSRFSSYTNNSFQNIGSSELTTGQIAAIWIGDITNCTNEWSASVVVSGNTFDTLTTGYDYNTDTANNYINANFISMRADKATIADNKIYNLLGYGLDRESIYTKVRDLTITDNYIENGGSGEGYICNKSAPGATSTTISGNTLLGNSGAGIMNYGTGTIENNTINIATCKYAIATSPRGDSTSTAGLTIKNNTITCGTNNSLAINGIAIPNYSAEAMIKLFNSNTPSLIQGNTLIPLSNFDTYIKIGSLVNNCTVSGNIIQAGNFNGIPIFIGSKESYSELCKSALINIDNNYISVLSGNSAIQIAISSTSATTNRSLTFSANQFSFTGDTAKSYALKCDTGGNNGDSLYFSQNTSNLPYNFSFINTNVSNIQNDDTTFALSQY